MATPAGSYIRPSVKKNAPDYIQKPVPSQITSLSQLDPNDPYRADALRYYQEHGTMRGWQNPGATTYYNPGDYGVASSAPVVTASPQGYNGTAAGYAPPSTSSGAASTGMTIGGGTPNYHSTIQAPTRVSLEDTYRSLLASGLIPEYQDIASLENPFDDSYYNNIADAATKRLNDSYFNNSDSLSARMKNQMNKRGLIGSGIEVGATNDLYKNFGDEMASLSSELSKQRADNDYNIATKNKEIEQRNIENRNALVQLGLATASDDARDQTDFATKMFGSQIDLEKSKYDQLANVIDSIQSLVGNRDVDSNDRRDYAKQLNDLLAALSY